MKTNFNVPRFLAISTLALALPLTAVAGGRHDGRWGDNDCDRRPAMEMRHQGGMAGLRGIDLTAEQVSALTKLRDEARKTFGEKRLALREQHTALHNLVMSDAYTPAAAAEIIAKITAAQSEMAQMRADQGNKVYQLLTPEQRTKMQQNDLMGRGSMGRSGKGDGGHGHRR
ncbi:MAG: Spy/CpxP family protein refolding chaperone [Propionivibrio sp.]